MKKLGMCLLMVLFVSVVATVPAKAQCSICTRTTQQLGERPARALNRGIIYLAFTPLALVGLIGYRWWRSEQQHD